MAGKRVMIPPPNLNIDEIREVDAFYEEDEPHVYYVECEPKQRYTGPCPECGCVGSAVRNGTDPPRRVHDISMGINQIDIILSTPKYICSECGKHFAHRYDFVEPRREISKRLEENIGKRALEGEFKSAAIEFGVTTTTVARILKEYGEALDATRIMVAPRVLGMDEVHIAKNMRGVFTDIENGLLLEMTEDRKKPSMEAAICAMKDYDKNIKIVCMDMSRGYKNVVEKCLPDAEIVVDKFHVVSLISTATEKARKEVYEGLKAKVAAMPDGADKERKQKILTRMGKDSYLFKYDNERIKTDSRRLSTMATLCKEFPELNELRLVKERAEAIYNKSTTPREAEHYISELIDHIPEADAYEGFRAFSRTLANWRTEILNYFKHGSLFTNATTEGLNSLIKRINHIGNGYSFETLRTKALYMSQVHVKPVVAKTRPKPKTTFRFTGVSRDWLADMKREVEEEMRAEEEAKRNPKYISGDAASIALLLENIDLFR